MAAEFAGETEAALRGTLRVIADFVAASTLPMLLAWDGGQSHRMNEACLQLGRRVQDAPDASSWSSLLQALAVPIRACLQDGECHSIDRRFAAPNERSTEHWCTLSLTPVRDEYGAVVGVLCVVIETTSLVQALRRVEEAQREASAQSSELAVLYSKMKEAVFHLSCDTDGRFRVRSVNSAFLAQTGMAQADLIGKDVEDVMPPERRSEVLAYYRQAALSGKPVQWTETRDFPNGRKYGVVSLTPVLDRHGRCSDLIGTVYDITEIKQTKEVLRAANAELAQSLAEQGRLASDLRASEERLGFALESSGEGIWDWDILNEKVHYSRRWKEILGLSGHVKDEFSLWFERMHPDDMPRVEESLRSCLRGTRTLCVDEHRLWHESGRWIWVHARGSVVARDMNGNALRMVGTIADTTATTELRHDLERSRRLLTKLTQHVPGVLFELVMYPDGRMSCPYVSAMASELLGRSPIEIEADFRCVLPRINERDRARMRRAMLHSAENLSPWRAEYRVNLPRMGECWRELSAIPTRSRDGSVVWHGFTNDITERKNTEQTIRQFQDKLEKRAHFDTLTGLPNRVLFRDRLEQDMKHARASGGAMALFFIDLDRFKEVNDLLGHDAGDNLLVQAARRIEACLQPGDTVARLGGDEFTVILTSTAEVAHVENTAQRIVDALRVPFTLGIKKVSVSGSIGIALYPGDATTSEELMRNADQAMYRSKGAGRDQLTFFESSMQEAAMRRLKVTDELRDALTGHQMELYFHPIIDAATGRICKAEALLRWHRKGANVALPPEFVEIAEETGMIHDLGNWVFFEAANWSQRWSAMLGRPFQISINKSPVQFQGHGLPAASWVEYLSQRGMARNSVAVEIGEGVLLNQAATDTLRELHDGGIEVAIDDFGTGYSSMTHLKSLDIDYLKIDRSFVSGMLGDADSQAITETIIVMAHKLGLKVIAEGVESREQRDWLAQHDCDYMQGFLFGQPSTANEFEAMLTRQPFVHEIGHA
ncbi:EAL domain-containing protein [Pseudoduganella sp. GCM10020061]|uniref:sensor domain-containing protein n=1 Tax=Pseudoduganella sp. GCM10020061 TaxID=3317345 RepID=UPI0036425E63